MHINGTVRLLKMAAPAEKDGCPVGRETGECLLILIIVDSRTVSNRQTVKIKHYQITAFVIDFHTEITAAVYGKCYVGGSKHTVSAILGDIAVNCISGLFSPGVQFDNVSITVKHRTPVCAAQMHE